jgi:hypothetical protein
MSAYREMVNRIYGAVREAHRDQVRTDKMTLIMHPAAWAAVRMDCDLPPAEFEITTGGSVFHGFPLQLDAKRDANSVVLRYEVEA